MYDVRSREESSPEGALLPDQRILYLFGCGV
jgi:hypothetical protein